MRVGNATIKSDLEAYKYQFEANAMDNGYVDERNKCFCLEGKYISIPYVIVIVIVPWNIFLLIIISFD